MAPPPPKNGRAEKARPQADGQHRKQMGGPEDRVFQLVQKPVRRFRSGMGKGRADKSSEHKRDRWFRH